MMVLFSYDKPGSIQEEGAFNYIVRAAYRKKKHFLLV
jgi:hypothetical protein